ncbi:MBL fold metallo-hydrolase [Oribacterium sp. WCC10]|uniref:MBL fold metallo-hydrolase n=1 Tax=Oribacterium sp. WCC10 TaxID=1855343 RepID=UPI0008E5A0A4|nr:MBL fold metallo-hydrolase [Oribacterium sp. WCC10]SFG07344.1 Phosphoribosyl 1,2-cyclic phosphodiesterase [Oribacterium sp. WCC10]
MRFTSIASGSSGNCTYIGTENTHILVDVGVNMKAVNTGLHELDLDLSDVNAIFLTHEHIDHIRAVGTISRKYDIPVYGTLGTLREVMLNRTLGDFSHEKLFPIIPDKRIGIGDLSVLPFSIYHDAADPLGYRIETCDRSDEEEPFGSKKAVTDYEFPVCQNEAVNDGEAEKGFVTELKAGMDPESFARALEKNRSVKKVAVATDLGHYDDYIASHLMDLDAMVIESNHDIRMLSTGPYPVSLKRRILSDHGHLSNDNCGRLLDSILSSHVKHVFLGHLSKENNLPDLALKTVQKEIDGSDSEHKAKEIDITVAHRDRISEIIEL